MRSLKATVRQIVSDLTRFDAEFAVVGGLAVSARTEPRFTRDADVAVSVTSDREAEDLIRALQHGRYVLKALLEQEAAGRLATVRLARSAVAGEPLIDLLFASSGIEPELVAEAEPAQVLSSLRVPVARIGHLLALKVLSRDDQRRPQDLVDLRALLRVASRDELDRARHALQLIHARGYHRGRDVVSEFERLLTNQ